MKHKLKEKIFSFFDNKQWFSVKDTLPETDVEFKEYLVFDILNKKVHHDYWNSTTKEWNHYGTGVTHWRELPDAPKS